MLALPEISADEADARRRRDEDVRECVVASTDSGHLFSWHLEAVHRAFPSATLPVDEAECPPFAGNFKPYRKIFRDMTR